MDLISIDNYEHTRLKNDTFQFNCFRRIKADTPPHWHNHTEIIFIKHGKCTVYINGLSRKSDEGEIILIPHGSLHSIISCPGSEYSAIVIGDSLFSSMIFDKHCERLLKPFLYENSFEPIYINKEHKSYNCFIEILNVILDEDTYDDPFFEMRIKVELCRFFLEMIRQYPDIFTTDLKAQSHSTIKMKSVIEHICTQYSEKIDISKMAGMSNMSKQHFCRVFKAYTGKTFIEFLSDYRLDQAVQLLKTTDLPISQLPELVGFCNGNYFSRVFKKRFGFPPSKIRSHSSASS